MARFIIERAPASMRALLLRLVCGRGAGVARRTPPTLLEWRAARTDARPALPLRLYDGTFANILLTNDKLCVCTL